jgi:cell wall-associated NlpC family hydrolase
VSAPHPLDGHEGLREVGVTAATVWTSPDAPRDVDAAAVADRPDLAAWTAAMDAQARLGLHGRTLTQLLLGEPALVLEESEGWSRVAGLHQKSSGHDHGYPGWVRTAHLATPVGRTTGPSAYVTAATATCLLDGGEQLEVSCGTALWVDDTVPGSAASVGVLLPGARRGALPRSAVRLSHKEDAAGFTPEDLLATARRFLGLRYLWGGTSGWGLDCSGLVHLTYRTHGTLVPRDAFDQAEAVEPVPLDEVLPGDLYFFARPGERVYHVGFATRRPEPGGDRWMLHAPEGGELVEDAPMAADRVAKLVSAGRFRTDWTRG